ncbi:hypothetical protein HGRIS_012517 [Hohenbuehelia grisea]|uniref:Copper-fist domain-containing protein n=1 Tax=Hohenbuehelia grisea TaxID=104357 RepID=A0ABR3ISH9_9AGAR
MTTTIDFQPPPPHTTDGSPISQRRIACCGSITLAAPVVGDASPATPHTQPTQGNSNNMVLVDNKKYACETCIKGHRSSSCKHTDRPLFEIKKKGRPVTQCEHCRELRKSKQVHVKCMCEARAESTSPVPSSSSTSTNKDKSKAPAEAAFPHGLPEALGASVGLLSSSESEHDASCSCSTGGGCNCCTPRKSAPRTRDKVAKAKSARASSSRSPEAAGAEIPDRMQSQIMARIAELRPVLPRPPSSGSRATQTGPVHHPSSNLPHAQFQRHHHHHAQSSFSPYSRAYEDASNFSSPSETYDNDFPAPQADMLPSDDDLQRLMQQVDTYGWSAPPNLVARTGEPVQFPSTCTCGSSCSCPGCFQHNASSQTSPSAFSHCTNPGACGACLDCTIMSFAATQTPLPESQATRQQQNETIEEWFGRISVDPSYDSSVSFDPNANQATAQWTVGGMGAQPEGFGFSDLGALTFATSNERPSALSTDDLAPSPTMLSSTTDSSLGAPFLSEPSLNVLMQGGIADARSLSAPPPSAHGSEGVTWPYPGDEGFYGGHRSSSSSTSLDQASVSEPGSSHDTTALRTRPYYR